MFNKWKVLFLEMFGKNSSLSFYKVCDALLTILLFNIYFVLVVFYPVVWCFVQIKNYCINKYYEFKNADDEDDDDGFVDDFFMNKEVADAKREMHDMFADFENRKRQANYWR